MVWCAVVWCGEPFSSIVQSYKYNEILIQIYYVMKKILYSIKHKYFKDNNNIENNRKIGKVELSVHTVIRIE